MYLQCENETALFQIMKTPIQSDLIECNFVILKDLMGNIMIVLVYMSSRLEQVQERKERSLTVEEVQEVVRLGATQFPR